MDFAQDKPRSNPRVGTLNLDALEDRRLVYPFLPGHVVVYCIVLSVLRSIVLEGNSVVG